MALAGREDKDQALKEFDGLLLKHIGFAVSNAASTLVLNLGFGHFEHAPGDKISQGYFRALNRQAAAFAMLADFSMMLLGGELKRRERLSARLGDVLSNLYLASAALKRYHDLDSPAYMEPLFRWAMEESLGQSERALDELLSVVIESVPPFFSDPLFVKYQDAQTVAALKEPQRQETMRNSASALSPLVVISRLRKPNEKRMRCTSVAVR